jgi:hypothetical protein
MRNALLWYPVTERLDYEIATLRLLLVRWLDHGSLITRLFTSVVASFVAL